MKVTYLSVAAKDGQTAAQRFAAMEKASGTFYIVGSDLYFEDKKITNAADLATAVQDISEIEATLTKLENTEETSGSIRNIIRSYLDADEIAVEDSDGNFDGDTVEEVLAELAASISSVGTAGAVTVEKTTGGSNDSFVTKYTFKQGGTAISNGEITIAKDMVATSGELVQPTAQNPITIDGQSVTSGTYILMTIANGTSFYVDVADLIEYNTFTDTAADGEIVVTDSNHSISMAIGKVAASKIIYRAADPTNNITEQTVAQAISALESASSTGVDDKISAAIALLDADVDASGTAAHSGTFVVSGVTEVDGVITAVDSVEVEAAGAAAAVLGTSSDTASENTVYGAKAAAAAAQSDVDALETYVGTIPSGATATDVVGYISEVSQAGVSGVSGSADIASISNNVVTLKAGVTQSAAVISNSSGSDITLEEVAVTGAAADVSVADSDGYFTATTVEAALAELAEQLLWNEV